MRDFLRRRALLHTGLKLGLAGPLLDVVSVGAQQGLPAATAAPAQAEPELPSQGSTHAASAEPLSVPDEVSRTSRAGAPFSNYGQPSPYERRVIRLIGANRDVPGNGVSWTPLEALEGIVTPNGLHFERHHNGVPAVDPATFSLVLHGMVQRPLRFDLATLQRYPLQSRLLFIECGGNSNAGWHAEPIQKPVGSFHGLVSCAEWTGVPLRLLLDECQIDTRARWGIVNGMDAAATEVSIPVRKLREDALLALYQNGERLRPENGYPLRLILPGWQGVTQIKWLGRIEFTDQPAMARNETAQYTVLLPSGKARQFDFIIPPKSVITSPSHGQRLPKPGLIELRGLAWSGHGSVRQVDVSCDGGRSWSRARLDGPVLDRCFTRFRATWNWDGSAAVLQSRVTDSQGNVQPARAALIAERGRNGYFGYNAIVSWAVDEDGTVRHVYA